MGFFSHWFGNQTEVVLGLGSNLGDRKFFIEQAIFHLKEFGEDVKVSSLWESPPMAGISNHDYLNAIMIFNTSLPLRTLWQEIQRVEALFRREDITQGKWGNKTLDIDIIFYGQERSSISTLEIPHKFAKDRAFVLVPLLEIAPQYYFFHEKAPAKYFYDKLSTYEKNDIHLFSSETRES